MNCGKTFALTFFTCLIAILSSAGLSAESITEAAVATKHGITQADVLRLHNYRGLTNADLMQMSTTRVRGTLWKLDNPRPDQPLGAAQYRLLQQAGAPDAPVPENALGRAIERVQSLRSQITAAATRSPSARSFSGPDLGAVDDVITIAGVPVGELAQAPSVQFAPRAAAGAPPDSRRGMLELEPEPLMSAPKFAPRSAEPPGGMTPKRWKWLGPGNIGGRTRAIVIHPQNPSIMWLGAVAGGIWKTVDGGNSWAPLADFLANLNVSTLALDPADPDTIYAGTGEGFYNLDAFRGAGLFRSADGGATWSQLSTTTGANFHFVNRIAITADGSTMLLGTRSGLYHSTNYRESDLNRVTFAPVAALAGREILDVRCDPRNADRCLAGGRGRTIHSTKNKGTDWSMATGLPGANPAERFEGRVELAYAAADSNIIYASVDLNGGELWRSTDGGLTFSRRNTGRRYLSGQGWYDNAVWAGDPQRADLVVVGGIDLYRSTDGGQTLTQISEWWRAPSSAHADQHVIVSHPRYNGTTNRIVYFGNDGGIYRNDDVLTAAPLNGWVAMNNNYGVTQFYGGAVSPLSGRIVGGTQDNGSLVYRPPPGSPSGPNGYTAMFGGDGGFSAADPSNPNFVYGEYVYLQIHRSIDGGERSSYIHSGIDEAGQSGGALFIAPFILDPANPKTMLAGGRSLWRSQNVRAATPQWTRIKAPLPPQAGRPVFISAIECSRTDASHSSSDIIWMGHTGGNIYRSLDGDTDAPSWERIDDKPGSGLPKRYVNRIRVNKNSPNTVYLAYAGYEKNNLWVSKNGGQSWSAISGPLPEASVYDIAGHPRNSDLLYAATEVGVFASADGGASWWPTNQGPANVAVMELMWVEEKLIAVSHGRGMFWIDLSEGVAEAYAGAIATPAAAPRARMATDGPPPPTATPHIVPISPLAPR